MKYGKVTCSLLNVRIIEPNRSRPAVSQLPAGTRVKIDFAVYGEDYKGIDVWYCLVGGGFIWSGGVQTRIVLKPVIRKYFFTADDYGAVETINRGIITALKAKALNSVACFTNYRKDNKVSIDMIRQLVTIQNDEGLDFEIGVHLTITSGSPVLGRDCVGLLCRPQGEVKGSLQSDFYEYTHILDFYYSLDSKDKNEFIRDLKRELQAQIDVMNDPPDKKGAIEISHLSVHHNTHMFHADFYRAFMDVAKSNQLRFRSVQNVPEWKDRLYMRNKGKIKSYGSVKAIKRIYCSEYKDTVSPGYFNSDHYGPIPMIRIYPFRLRHLQKKKNRKLIRILREFRVSKFKTMEILLHLREKKIFGSHREYDEELKKSGYEGVDSKAFDSRTAEFCSIMSFEASGDKGLTYGSWKELLPGEYLC